ncbi:putative glycerol-3-phosphate 1-O-acyltransferase [Helianthus annuus]|nr:putative glycerol-3-phosphate 1-O-acyltransferase [Helianthus annuus]
MQQFWMRDHVHLLFGIQREVEAGRLPKSIAQAMEELYQNYKTAWNPHAEDIVLSNMRVAFERMFLDVKEPFEFLPYHEAIREPFNYYMFGQDYIRPFDQFQGENVILISNHQSEADPAVIALLLENNKSLYI